MDSSSVSTATTPRASRVVILLDLDVAFEGYLGRTRQPDVVSPIRPVYAQFAPARAHVHLSIELSTSATDGYSGTSTRPTGERLPRAALVDPKTNLGTV